MWVYMLVCVHMKARGNHQAYVCIALYSFLFNLSKGFSLNSQASAHQAPEIYWSLPYPYLNATVTGIHGTGQSLCTCLGFELTPSCTYHKHSTESPQSPGRNFVNW